MPCRSRRTLALPAAAVVAFTALLLLLLVNAGCGNDAQTGTPAPGPQPSGAGTGGYTATQSAQPAAQGAALLSVALPDGSSRPFALDDLKALPQVSVPAGGETEDGPLLSSVLQAAGISGYARLTVSGSSGRLDVDSSQVNGQLVLDFTKRDTVKLASPAIDKDQWVKDVNRIEVH